MKKTSQSFFVFFKLFIMFLFVSIYSYGQNYLSFRYERDQIIKDTKLKIGPIRIFPAIRLREIGYDDNVYYQRNEDNPVSDYTATISPEVKLYLLSRNNLILSLTENPEYVHYFKQKRERGWNNTVSPEVKFLFLSRFVISGSYLYSQRRWRPTSEFDIRANELRKSYRGSLFFETARRTSFGISASSDKISYEDITLPGAEIYLSRLLDREERSGYLEFYYRIFSESLFFMRGGYTEYDFEHKESQWRNSYSSHFYSGIRFPLFGRIMGALSLGYRKLSPRNKEKRDFSGLICNTSLDLRPGRFILRFQYNRDFNFSYWTNSIYFVEDRFGSGLSFYLTRFLRLDYNFSYGEANYPEKIPQKLPDGRYEEIKRKDIYRIHMAGFVFRVIRNTGIGLIINFWGRQSNYYWENRDRLFVGGYITYEF